MKKFPLVFEHRVNGVIQAVIVIKSTKLQDSYAISRENGSISYTKITNAASKTLLNAKEPKFLFNMSHPMDAIYPKPILNVIESASWSQIKPLIDEMKKSGIKENGKLIP